MRALKFAIVFFMLIVAAGVAYTGFYFHSCLGRMQACYASFRSATSGADCTTQERLQSIHAGLTASEKLVAFPVPLGNGSNGIILVSAGTDRVRLISTSGYSHWSPQLSTDGERLIFVRGASSEERELVTCEIGSWQCSILFRSPRQLVTPVDVGNGYVLFAANKPREGDEAKSRRFDIFAVRRGEQPKQLTDYEMYEVQSLSVAKDRILFGADGRHGFEPSSCPPRDLLKCDKSDIYMLGFDPQQMAVLNKPDLLKPLFVVSGYSTRPVISPDAKRVAFKNTNRQGNPWRYNTAISDTGGVVEGGVSVQGYAFSASAFAGNWLFVNEVFEDHYRILRIDLASKKVDGFEVKHSPEYLKSVEPITLSVAGLASVR
jgi:hypothetical protein